MTAPFPSVGSIRLELFTGDSLDPAPVELIEALERVEVNAGDSAPSGFQLVFRSERVGSGSDTPLIAGGHLDPFGRIALVVTVDHGHPTVLMDGYITHQQLSPSSAPGGSTVTVTGEDVSVKMDLMEISFEWPGMGDFLIAEAVLLKYALIGIWPEVVPTVADVIPFGYVPQQNGTDRSYVQQLAQENGYLFYVVPGDTLGRNRAYWGPPELSKAPQPVLSVDMGPFTNVQSMCFSYNSLAPTLTYGLVQTGIIPVPVFAASSTRSPEMATDPALEGYESLVTNPLSYISSLLSLKVRGTLLQHAGMGAIQSWRVAQAQTNLSTDDVVTVEGTLSTLRYGHVLDAPGTVDVRGAGTSYDGRYYVKAVTHQISARTDDWDYTQKFTLTREGTGSTIEEV